MLEVIKIEETGTEPKSGDGGSGGILKVLVLLVAVAGITAVVVYIGIGLGYNAMLNSKEETIVTLQDKIYELELESPVSTPCPGAAEAEIVCSICHDLDQTKGFHDTNSIKLMGEAQGTTPRICTICHGSKPHDVHKKKTDSGEMSCEDCHVPEEGGDFETPQVPEGKTLVCEACHVGDKEPEDVGNYISIHIVEANRNCNICHMGDPVKVHKKATEELGVIG